MHKLNKKRAIPDFGMALFLYNRTLLFYFEYIQTTSNDISYVFIA